MKYSSGSVAGARVLGLVADQEREQPGQEEAQREAVAEARPAEQERRPEAEPAGRPDRAGQVPGPVQRLVPAARRGQRLAAGADAVEQHPERPDELEPAAPLAPLVEQGDREDERQDRGQGGQDDGRVHVSDRVLVRRDEPQQQPVEQARGVLVQRREAGGIERPPPAEPGQLGEERPAGRHEQADRLGQARARRPRGGGRGRRRGPSPRLRSARVPPRRRLGVEVGDERLDQAPAVAPVHARARSSSSAGTSAAPSSRRVAPPVGPGQAFRARAQAGERPAAGVGGWRRAPRSSRRSKRRWPPGVTYASTRPSSAQRRRVSGSTPSSRLAGPSDSQRGAATAESDTRGLDDWEPTGRARVGGYARPTRRHGWNARSNLGKSGYRRSAHGAAEDRRRERPCQTGSGGRRRRRRSRQAGTNS